MAQNGMHMDNMALVLGILSSQIKKSRLRRVAELGKFKPFLNRGNSNLRRFLTTENKNFQSFKFIITFTIQKNQSLNKKGWIYIFYIVFHDSTVSGAMPFYITFFAEGQNRSAMFHNNRIRFVPEPSKTVILVLLLATFAG